MKKINILITGLLMLASSIGFAGRNGSEGGNGGGGVIKDGRPQTFYSAGIITEIAPESAENIPGLTGLSNNLNQMPISEDLKIKWLTALTPTDRRQYFKVLPDYFDDETQKRLIGEYSRLTGQPVDQLVLFAVTDTTTETTYLLPNFYSLTLNEQKAILAHEAYWIINPNTTYKQVTDVEYAFQAYEESPSDFNRVEALLSKIGTSEDIFQAVVQQDAQTNALGDLTNDGKIALSDLFGTDFTLCKLAMPECQKRAYSHLFSLAQSHPNSKLLRFLVQSLADGNNLILEAKVGDGELYSSERNTYLDSGAQADLLSVLLRQNNGVNDVYVTLGWTCEANSDGNQVCGLQAVGSVSYNYTTDSALNFLNPNPSGTSAWTVTKTAQAEAEIISFTSAKGN